jgi:transcriptional regulator with XRE-family HTH domain
MAKHPKLTKTGLYHAREARGMSRTELVKRSGVSKQQLSRLENGHIRLRLDHLKPFVGPLGYTPEQMLLWGRYPGTGLATGERGKVQGKPFLVESRPGEVLELARHFAAGTLRSSVREVRRDGRHSDPIKSDRWFFPSSFVKEQLHTSPDRLLIIEAEGDSMAPTISAGDRVVIDTGHKDPTPDGLYAIRDTLKSVVVRRLQLLRSARPPRIKIISDNHNHPPEEVTVADLEVVGKVVCVLKIL